MLRSVQRLGYCQIFKGGKFTRERKLFVSKEGDPAIEDWKEVGPLGAGMFARGSYPTSKAFYMTYRFDLRDSVDPKALKSAWEKTLKVYPYMSYAVGARDGRYVLLENPLPFVITSPLTPSETDFRYFSAMFNTFFRL